PLSFARMQTMSVAVPRFPVDYGGPVDRPFEPFPRSALEGSIIERFNAVAARFSYRLAVSDGSSRLTYGELAALVNRIAKMTNQAVRDRPGPVATLLPRDCRFPAAMLGALAAGHGCIPLDLTNPEGRNRLIAIRSGAAAVLSASALASDLDGRF